MYAVIKTGGKQYRVTEGDVVTIEKLEAEVGSTVNFAEVLMIGGDAVKVGAPLVDGASVDAEVVSQYKGKKVHIVKFKRRKHHLKRQGHRQLLTKVKVNKINA